MIKKWFIKFIFLSCIFNFFSVNLLYKINNFHKIFINKLVANINDVNILHSDVKKEIFFMCLNDSLHKKDFCKKKIFLYDQALNNLIINNLLLQNSDPSFLLKINSHVDHDIQEFLNTKKMLNEKDFYCACSQLDKNFEFTYEEYLTKIKKVIILEYLKNDIVKSNIQISSKEFNKIYKKNLLDEEKKYYVDFCIVVKNLINEKFVKIIDNFNFMNVDDYTEYFNTLEKDNNVKNESMSLKDFESFIHQKVDINLKNYVFKPFIQGTQAFFIKINNVYLNKNKFLKKMYNVHHILIKYDSYGNHSPEYIKNKVYRLYNNIITNKNSFEELEKKYSNDITLSNYGDLGWFNDQEFDKNFKNVFPSIDKNNCISKPIESKLGWNIFQLNYIKNKNFFNKYVENNTYLYFFKKDYDDVLNKYIDKIKKLSYIKIFYTGKITKNY
ncbi:peptidylprolyl isomerase [Buchnera aphidicola]|uniref:peptidylprolyl isomerase n=1 Tax=Buchnera aphidicola TaxID=9 RepID=UPI0030ECA349